MGSIKQNYANNVLTNGKFDATDLDGVIPNTNINDNSIDNVTVFGTAGSGIPSVASDPPSPTIGDVWYNTTTNAFKYTGAGVGAWVSGGNMNTARSNLAPAVSGTQTAALSFGGYIGGPFPTSVSSANEKYNGTSWTTATNLNSARYQLTGAGTQTAALAFGGFTVGFVSATLTETYNGSSWTEVNDLNTGRYGLTGLGLQTAALAVGGTPGTAQIAFTESWDGTSWTEVNDLNTATGGHFVSGISTRALSSGGNVPPGSTRSNKNEAWDGTSWTEVNNLTTARAGSGGMSGTTTSGALVAGGNTGSYVATTEEFSLTPQVTKTITTA